MYWESLKWTGKYVGHGYDIGTCKEFSIKGHTWKETCTHKTSNPYHRVSNMLQQPRYTVVNKVKRRKIPVNKLLSIAIVDKINILFLK